MLRGGLTFHSKGMEVMPMKNQFDFKDMLTFGIAYIYFFVLQVMLHRKTTPKL